jgi:hypothetical protein
VIISGAAGVWADIINGVYVPGQDKGLDGRVIYLKRGDASVIMEHLSGDWQVKPASSKGTARQVVAFVPGRCALDACIARSWMEIFEMNGQDKLATSPGLTLRIITPEELDRYVSG